jgi:hypothetical protein
MARISKLSEEDIELFVRGYVAGMTIQEMHEASGVSYFSVRVALNRTGMPMRRHGPQRQDVE